jgi:hypothetical protein
MPDPVSVTVVEPPVQLIVTGTEAFPYIFGKYWNVAPQLTATLPVQVFEATAKSAVLPAVAAPMDTAIESAGPFVTTQVIGPCTALVCS